MTGYESYIFLLCLLVFVALTSILAAMTAELSCASIHLIRSGAEDEKIEKNYKKSLCRKKTKSKLSKWITGIISGIAICLFAFSVYVNVMENKFTKSVPVFRVVKTESMSNRNKENKYLYEHNLTNQFSAFDLIITHKIPAEKDLELYDVVVYEIDDILLVHRIVGIEEPNEKHPSERYFLLQGDAVGAPDRFPVLYKQMKGIYRGQKLPFVGSFVLFLQSPAGYMCMALIIFANVALPIMEKRIDKEEQKRLTFLLRCKKDVKKQENKQVLGNNPPLILPPIVFYPEYYPIPNKDFFRGKKP